MTQAESVEFGDFEFKRLIRQSGFGKSCGPLSAQERNIWFKDLEERDNYHDTDDLAIVHPLPLMREHCMDNSEVPSGELILTDGLGVTGMQLTRRPCIGSYGRFVDAILCWSYTYSHACLEVVIPTINPSRVSRKWAGFMRSCPIELYGLAGDDVASIKLTPDLILNLFILLEIELVGDGKRRIAKLINYPVVETGLLVKSEAPL
jgi:hypothetical protein